MPIKMGQKLLPISRRNWTVRSCFDGVERFQEGGPQKADDGFITYINQQGQPMLEIIGEVIDGNLVLQIIDRTNGDAEIYKTIQPRMDLPKPTPRENWDGWSVNKAIKRS